MADVQIEIRDHRRPGWFWLNNEMIDIHGREIGVYGLAVYCCLARLANNRSQRAWPGLKRLAGQIRTGKHQVVDALRKLEAAGLVIIERRPGQSNVYTLCAVVVTGAREAPVIERGGAGEAPGGAGEALPPVPEKHMNKTHVTRLKNNTKDLVVAFSNSLVVALGELGMSDVGIAFLNRTWSETECRTALSWVMVKDGVSNPSGYLLSMAKRGVSPTDFVPASPVEKANDDARKAEQVKARTCWERDRQPCRSVEEEKCVYTWCEHCDLFVGKVRTNET